MFAKCHRPQKNQDPGPSLANATKEAKAMNEADNELTNATKRKVVMQLAIFELETVQLD